MNYKYLEDEATADLAIKAWGKDIKQAFTNTALALMNAIVETQTVEEQEIKYITKKAEDLKSLLYELLDEILYYHDAENIVFKSIHITDFDKKNFTLNAVIKGEIFDKQKHKPLNNVKAITYYEMNIIQKDNRTTIKVIVDL